MKFAVGFVIYNPEENDLVNIQRWIDDSLFEKYLIYDNSTNSHSFTSDNKLKYYYNGKNDGLPIAYNVLISYCIQESIDYLCLMDQDSDYPFDEVNKMIGFIKNSYKNIREFPIIAPRSYCVTSARVKREEKLTDAKYVINSGTFLNISVLKENNLRYDEKIFLDGVDYDFCMTLHRKGFPVKIYEDSVLIQNLGYTRIKKGKKFVCHSELRYYYIVKARNYTNLKNHGRIKGALINTVKLFGTIFYICSVEDNKRKKILAVLKANCGLVRKR